MEKGECVRVIEGEVRRDDPVEYLLPMKDRSTFRIPEGVMAIEIAQNEEIFGGGKSGGRKGVGSAIRWRGANRGAYTLRNDSEDKFFREMLIPT